MDSRMQAADGRPIFDPLSEEELNKARSQSDPLSSPTSPPPHEQAPEDSISSNSAISVIIPKGKFGDIVMKSTISEYNQFSEDPFKQIKREDGCVLGNDAIELLREISNGMRYISAENQECSLTIKELFETTLKKFKPDRIIEACDQIVKFRSQVTTLNATINDLKRTVDDLHGSLPNIRTMSLIMDRSDNLISKFDETVANAVAGMIREKTVMLGTTSKVVSILPIVLEFDFIYEKMSKARVIIAPCEAGNYSSHSRPGIDTCLQGVHSNVNLTAVSRQVQVVGKTVITLCFPINKAADLNVESHLTDRSNMCGIVLGRKFMQDHVLCIDHNLMLARIEVNDSQRVDVPFAYHIGVLKSLGKELVPHKTPKEQWDFVKDWITRCRLTHNKQYPTQ